MIQLQRIRSKENIPAAFRDPKRVKRNEALIRDFKAANLNLASALWSKAKRGLRKESGDKCAYCEAPASATAHCDVEHFRPKAHYWWLALCYDNYLYACQICNQVYKSDHFPVAAQRIAGPSAASFATDQGILQLSSALFPDPMAPAEILAAFELACRNELADLMNPYSDNPDHWFAWEVDDVLKEVRLIARRPNDARCRRIIAAAESYLGLNREELRQLRYRLYSLVEPLAQVALLDAIPLPVKTKATTALSEAMGHKAMFAGMVRYFVSEIWKIPLPIPA